MCKRKRNKNCWSRTPQNTSIILHYIQKNEFWNSLYSRCCRISWLVYNEELCNDIWSIIHIFEDSSLISFSDWLDSESSCEFPSVSCFENDLVHERIKHFIENDIWSVLVSRDQNELKERFFDVYSLRIVRDFLSIWYQIKEAAIPIEFIDWLSSIDRESERESRELLLNEINIWSDVCSYAHNFLNRLFLIFSTALLNVSAHFEWNIVPSCMCQFTGVFLHQNSTFSEYSHSLIIVQMIFHHSFRTQTILLWERNVHDLTGDFNWISSNSSGRISFTVLMARSSIILLSMRETFVHIL